MRFRAALQPSPTFGRFVASLASIGNVAWMRLDDNEVRFTIIPEQGSQVWAVLSIDALFGSYTLQSAAPANTINIEVPLQPLLRALRSTTTASTTSHVRNASIRLTKKDNQPSLCVTLLLKTPIRSTLPSTNAPTNGTSAIAGHDSAGLPVFARERETKISQDVPVCVLSAQQVSTLHEPRARDPDVHIMLPPLAQLKSISDRFTRLASTTSSAHQIVRGRSKPPKLTLSANMHGSLKLGLSADGMEIQSVWRDLTNPVLDPGNLEGGEDGVARHPSTRMRELPPDDERGWATVRVDARDWGRVLGVGRCAGKVIACFCHEHALILYVYLESDDGSEDSVLTYYVSSYSS